MPSHRTHRGEKKRQVLRRAAFACFSAHGYHATTVDQIVEHAGTSKGSFYWHYDTKLAVLVDILGVWGRDVMEALTDRFEPAVQRHDDNLSRLDAIAGAFVDELERGREMLPLWLEFTALAPREPEVAAALARYYARGRRAIADMLEPVLGAGVDDTTRQGIAAALFSFYLGLLMQETPDPDQASAPRSVRRLLDAVHASIDKAATAPRYESETAATTPPAALMRSAGPLLRGHVIALWSIIRDVAPHAAITTHEDTGRTAFGDEPAACELSVAGRALELRFHRHLGHDLSAPGLDTSGDTPTLRLVPSDGLDPACVRELVMLAFARRHGAPR